LVSRRIKGEAFGGTEDAWVVTEDVHRAIAIAEALTGAAPGERLFAKASNNSSRRYTALSSWVNSEYGQRLGLEPIPDGPVNPRALRRTLAMAIAQRPHGLMARQTAPQACQRRHSRGLCRPPRRTPGRLRSRSRRRGRSRTKTLHLGVGNYCWFSDPGKALCLKIAGTPDAAEPLLGMCDSARCPQATHHPRHRQIWADHADNTQAVFLGNPRLSKPERARAQTAFDRATRIVAEIDAAGHPAEEPRS
jgi:hypothetical protein